MDLAFNFDRVWCGEVTLDSMFPELYSIARNKEALVSDYMYSSGIYVHWNPAFVKVVQDWELESLVAFLDLL